MSEDKMIESLTEEQLSLMEEHKNKWIKKFYDDHGKYAVHDTYKKLCKKIFEKFGNGLEFPERFEVSSNQDETAVIFKILSMETGVEFNIRDVYENAISYIDEYPYFSKYTFCRDVLGIESQSINDYLDCYEEIFLYCSHIWVYDKFVVVQEKPLYVKVDEDLNLHCDDGPAIEWKGGKVLYFNHGSWENFTFIERTFEQEHPMTFIPKLSIGLIN